jgi:hypothetical protein
VRGHRHDVVEDPGDLPKHHTDVPVFCRVHGVGVGCWVLGVVALRVARVSLSVAST